MSVSLDYLRLWKSYAYNGTTYQVYGQTSVASSMPYWITVTSASSFDCSWFWYNNQYLWIWVLRVRNDWSSSTSAAFRVEIQAEVDWTWETREIIFRQTYTIAAWGGQQLHATYRLTPNVLDDTATSYRIRTIVADNDWNFTRYNTFTLSNVPASGWDITVYDCSVWKNLTNSGTVVQTFRGKEEWSIDLSSVPRWNWTSWWTSISCSWLQKWHYIGVSNLTVEIPNSISTDTVVVRFELQWNINWTWETLYTDIIWETEVQWWYYRTWREVLWIWPDTVWTNTNTYRCRRFWVSEWWHWNWQYYRSFTISNLDINDTKATPWCRRVEWNTLCYTDWDWYKRIISHDWTTPTAVWNQYAWSVWIVNSWITEMKKIYYVSSNWFIYKTHVGRRDARWSSLPSPWTSYRWSIWVDRAWMYFVTANWDVVALWNWDV